LKVTGKQHSMADTSSTTCSFSISHSPSTASKQQPTKLHGELLEVLIQLDKPFSSRPKKLLRNLDLDHFLPNMNPIKYTTGEPKCC